LFEETLAAQIIQKAAPTFESNLGVSHFSFEVAPSAALARQARCNNIAPEAAKPLA
jgi:hypothetical protein